MPAAGAHAHARPDPTDDPDPTEPPPERHPGADGARPGSPATRRRPPSRSPGRPPTDDTGVVGYRVTRNGNLVASPADVTWKDTARKPRDDLHVHGRGARRRRQREHETTITRRDAARHAAPTRPRLPKARARRQVTFDWAPSTDNVASAVPVYRVAGLAGRDHHVSGSGSGRARRALLRPRGRRRGQPQRAREGPRAALTRHRARIGHAPGPTPSSRCSSPARCWPASSPCGWRPAGGRAPVGLPAADPRRVPRVLPDRAPAGDRAGAGVGLFGFQVALLGDVAIGFAAALARGGSRRRAAGAARSGARQPS